MTNSTEQAIKFKNVAPESEEWSAHIDILNNWTTPDRYLRDIIQYARSGAFFPADMHVDLIRQVIEAETDAKAQKTAIEELMWCHKVVKQVSFTKAVTKRIACLKSNLKGKNE